MCGQIIDVIFLKKSLKDYQTVNLKGLNRNTFLLFRLYALLYFKYCTLRKSRVLKKRKKYKSAVFLFLWGLQQKIFIKDSKKKFIDILYTYYLSSFFFFF